MVKLEKIKKITFFEANKKRNRARNKMFKSKKKDMIVVFKEKKKDSKVNKGKFKGF